MTVEQMRSISSSVDKEALQEMRRGSVTRSRAGRSYRRSGTRIERRWTDPDPALILLDSALNPLAFNREAAKIFYDPMSPTDQSHGLAIPEQILDSMRGGAFPSVSTDITTFRTANRTYLCRAIVMEPCDRSSAAPQVLLAVRKRSSVQDAIYGTAVHFNLTDREREALEGISKGMNARDLAKSMNISPNTVKAYMHLIMVKMGVQTRAAVIAKILEYTGGNGEELRADAHGAGTR